MSTLIENAKKELEVVKEKYLNMAHIDSVYYKETATANYADMKDREKALGSGREIQTSG